LERGKMIKIGLRWWHGGAQKYYYQMQGDDPYMRFFDGDFKNFDMRIHRILMELYCICGGIYFDFSRNRPEDRAYKLLLKATIKWLTQRLTHMFGDIWKMIIGCMPSGAWDTSHGDSWICGFLFWLFFELQFELNPHRRVNMNYYFANGKVHFCCYGDDHNGSSHVGIVELINETAFAKFVARIFGMEIQEIRNNVEFLSEPDFGGGLRSRGMVFLQRYFIRRPKHFPDTTAHILPYRPITKYYWKLPFCANGVRTGMDFLLACCGSAYDTMGTNLVAYEFIRHVFYSVSLVLGVSTAEIRKHYEQRLNDPKERDFTKIMMKANVTKEDLLNGFPSMEGLIKLNVYDADYLEDHDDAFDMYTNVN